MYCPICNELLAKHTKHDLDTCATKLVGHTTKPTVLLSDLYTLARAVGCTIRVFSDEPEGVSVFLDVPGQGMKSYTWEKANHKKLLIKEMLELVV